MYYCNYFLTSYSSKTLINKGILNGGGGGCSTLQAHTQRRKDTRLNAIYKHAASVGFQRKPHTSPLVEPQTKLDLISKFFGIQPNNFAFTYNNLIMKIPNHSTSGDFSLLSIRGEKWQTKKADFIK